MTGLAMGDEGRDAIPLRVMLVEGARQLGLEHPVETAKVFGSWRELVGDQVAARCDPVGLSRGVLRVRAATATWASELRYLAPELIRRVNAGVGLAVVREVKVTMRPAGEETAPSRGPSRSSGQVRGNPGRPKAGHPGSADDVARWAGQTGQRSGQFGPGRPVPPEPGQGVERGPWRAAVRGPVRGVGGRLGQGPGRDPEGGFDGATPGRGCSPVGRGDANVVAVSPPSARRSAVPAGQGLDADELVRGIPDERLAAATKRALLAAKTHPKNW
ncbi:MAG: DciA family protein [Actinomycetota bacterium]